MTSCEGRDHGNSRDSRDCTHHYAHHARRHVVRLQGIPYTNRKQVTDNISLQITVSKKETFQPTPLRGRLALVVNLALLNGVIRPIASNENEEGRHTNNRVEIDLHAEMCSRMILRESQQIGKTSVCRIWISASSHSCC